MSIIHDNNINLFYCRRYKIFRLVLHNLVTDKVQAGVFIFTKEEFKVHVYQYLGRDRMS